MPRIDFDLYSSDEDDDDLDSPSNLVRPNRRSNQRTRQEFEEQEDRNPKKPNGPKRIDKRNFES